MPAALPQAGSAEATPTRLPAWLRRYDRGTLGRDLLAALIVVFMLVPQSLAYALLAGLPPEAGLAASMLPLVGYAAFGSSSVLAVGPVAVTSLMTAGAIAPLVAAGTPPVLAAALLALLVGGLLAVAGLARLGRVADFLSHSVVQGFISATALLIACGQLQHLLGVRLHAEALPEILGRLWTLRDEADGPTSVLGVLVVLALLGARTHLRGLLERAGVAPRRARLASQLAPVVVLAAAGLAAATGLPVATVGTVPAALPTPALPSLGVDAVRALLVPAALIALVAFVESIAVARSFAVSRRERVDADRELLGLGLANLCAGGTGGLPVAGGLSRTVVNAEAGAASPAAGVYAALGIALLVTVAAPLFALLPRAALAATVVVAVLPLIDPAGMRRTWRYSRGDGAVAFLTCLATCLIDVETGLATGVLASLALRVHQTSRPHFAIVGRVPGTEHFRNVERHQVETSPAVVTLRVDESLWFGNARILGERVAAVLAGHPEVRHLVLMCSSVSEIDASALETLDALNRTLGEAGVSFHLSEVKGPVMDRLAGTQLLAELSGRVFLTQYQAHVALAGTEAGPTGV